MTTLTPKLRFPEFSDKWEVKKLSEISKNGFSNGVFNDPRKVGSGYKIINVKDMFVGNEIDIETLTLVNIEEKEFLKNKVEFGDIFFTRSSLAKEGIAISNVNLSNSDKLTYDGHLIKMSPKLDLFNPRFLALALKFEKTRYQFVVKGKTTTMTTIGQEEVSSVFLSLPKLPEQTKIANFLTSVDNKIQALKEKKRLLEEYKKGLMQMIFAQEIRFKQENGCDFPDWEEKSLGEILTEHKTRNLKNQVEEVFSVAKNKGVINQIEHLGRSYASEITTNYKVVYPADIIYTKSPTSDFPFGIIKQNKLNRTGIVSVLYGVFTPKNKYLGLLLDYYFSIWQNTYNYLNPLVQKGAKNTMNIGNNDFLNGEELYLPSSTIEQQKIAKFLTSIDEKIEKIGQQIEDAQTFKKGLLQQMFV